MDIVLKSLMTEQGAERWIAAMNKENVEVVSTDTLKSMYPNYEVAPEYGYHVVEVKVEPSADDIRDALDGVEGDIELVRALVDLGIAEICDEYGDVSLTDRWYDAVSTFRREAFNAILKSHGVNVPVGDISDPSEKIQAVTDADAAKANEETLPATTDPMPGEAVTEADVDTVDNKEPVEENVEEEAVIKGIVFKSLREAREWQNPDPERYVVRATTFDEKRTRGASYGYIVDDAAPKTRVGQYGNKIR